jgi:hypothetical protein
MKLLNSGSIVNEFFFILIELEHVVGFSRQLVLQCQAHFTTPLRLWAHYAHNYLDDHITFGAGDV